MVLADVPSPVMLELCSPSVLLLALASPVRPPGFDHSPTPTLVSSAPLRHTLPPKHRRVVMVADADLVPLFQERQEALLPLPDAPPPRPPVPRRKTMADMTMCCNSGFSLQRTSARLKAAGRATSQAKTTPVAKVAEALVCRGLGITRDGEDVTVEMFDAFSEKFKEQLPPEVIVAMRGLFKLDDAQAAGVKEELILHGGDGALDQEGQQAAA